ncbi:coil containing protein [Vibrio phage 1.064.O._10N.261.52.E2]|nr:coil containing protein [Vibrio phage 1.064.O._10N.261.52.E2]AUR88110.1 coil containing protein [Vibrio phage 1.108.O._10N.222.51.A4]
MLSETTKELLEARKQIKELKAQIAAEKTKKPTMKPMSVRFHSSAESGCEMLANKYDWQWSKSDIARAAMYLGLKQLNEVSNMSEKQLNGLMHVINLRCKFGKQ